MKILVISNYRETVSVRPEAELFIGLKKEGVDVHIMTYGDAPYVKQFEEAGIPVIKFHPQKKLNRKEIQFIRSILLEGQYDILHLFNSKAIINGIQAAKNIAVKVVLYRGYTGNIHWYDPTAYFKYLHPRVDKIWCIAKSIETYIQQQLFYDKTRPVTIHKGHNLNWYNGITPIQRSALPDIPENGFWVVHVSNNRPMKGIPFLLESMQFIPPDLPIHLILIGKNMDHAANLKIIEHFPNKSHIHFLGYRTDVLNIVKSSNVFVLSSLFGEAITKAVIEAMSLGIAPVITDIPGNKSLVDHNKNGMVVPTRNARAIADAVLNLYKDPKKCQQIGAMAQKQIREQFNIQKTIRQIKNMYASLIE